MKECATVIAISGISVLLCLLGFARTPSLFRARPSRPTFRSFQGRAQGPSLAEGRELFDFFAAKAVEPDQYALEISSRAGVLSAHLGAFLGESHFFSFQYEALASRDSALTLGLSSRRWTLFDVVIVTAEEPLSDNQLAHLASHLAPGAKLWLPWKAPQLGDARPTSVLGQYRVLKAHEGAPPPFLRFYEVAFEYRPPRCGFAQVKVPFSHMMLPTPPACGLKCERPAVQPIFVVGCGHSGTTLLLSLLSAHPDVLGLWETGVFVNGEKNKAKTEERLQEWTKIAGATKKTAWVEKTPSHICFLGLVLRRFPAARILHITRHGDEVIPSLQQRRRCSVEKAVSRYVNDNAAGLLGQGDPRVMRVKYEDLVERPILTMVRICAHARIPFKSGMLLDFDDTIVPFNHANEVLRHEQLRRPLLDTTVHWRTNLTSDEMELYRRRGERGILQLLDYSRGAKQREPGKANRLVVVTEDASVGARIAAFLNTVPALSIAYETPSLDAWWNSTAPLSCPSPERAAECVHGLVVTYEQLLDGHLTRLDAESVKTLHVVQWNKIDVLAGSSKQDTTKLLRCVEDEDCQRLVTTIQLQEDKDAHTAKWLERWSTDGARVFFEDLASGRCSSWCPIARLVDVKCSRLCTQLSRRNFVNPVGEPQLSTQAEAALEGSPYVGLQAYRVWANGVSDG
eukprot:scaffold47_cov258-Pinguiococcus_pyrenoidosus.AAC.81